MKLNFAVVAMLSSLIAVSTAEARGPYGSINVGHWKGCAYTNAQTGEFSHCRRAPDTTAACTSWSRSIRVERRHFSIKLRRSRLQRRQRRRSLPEEA